MPSGSKKRKAAKKKKEKGANSNPSSANNNNNNHPLGNDDVKAQESDGGEVSTPASQDHDNHNSPFHEGGEDLEKRGPSSVGSFAPENKSMEGVVGDAGSVELEDVGVVEVVRELESQGDSESKTISIEHVKSSKGSHGRDDSSSSSGSSSDDESRADEKKAEEAHNSVMEAPVSDSALEKAAVGEVSNSALENAPVSDAVKPVVSVPEEVIGIKECAPVESSVASDQARSALKVNGEKSLPKLDGLMGASPTVLDLESKKVEAKVYPMLSKNGEPSSNGVKFTSEESEDKVVSSSHGLSDETGNAAEHTKNSEIPQCTENQPLLPVAPRPVQTTSWKSCCGIFEVLTGSTR